MRRAQVSRSLYAVLKRFFIVETSDKAFLECKHEHGTGDNHFKFKLTNEFKNRMDGMNSIFCCLCKKVFKHQHHQRDIWRCVALQRPIKYVAASWQLILSKCHYRIDPSRKVQQYSDHGWQLRTRHHQPLDERRPIRGSPSHIRPQPTHPASAQLRGGMLVFCSKVGR